MENNSRREAALLNNSRLLQKSFHLTPNSVFASLSSAVQSIVSKTVAMLGSKPASVEANIQTEDNVLAKARKRETFW